MQLLRQREPGLSWEREDGRALTRGQLAACISAAAWVGEASWLLFSASTECARSSGISHLLQRCDRLLCGWFPDSAAVLTSPCSKIFSVKTNVCFAPFALSESMSPCGFVKRFLSCCLSLRFQKYRGLKSFRTSPWDPKENLPRDYARIFQFQDFFRTRKHLFRQIEKEEAEGALVTPFSLTFPSLPLPLVGEVWQGGGRVDGSARRLLSWRHKYSWCCSPGFPPYPCGSPDPVSIERSAHSSSSLGRSAGMSHFTSPTSLSG